MISETTPVSLPAAALLAVRRLATTIVALGVVLAADLVLDGTPMTIVAVAVFLVLLASYIRRDTAREDPERPRDAFDAVKERASTAAQFGPVILAIGLFVVADLDPAEFAATALALFFVSTTVLLRRLNRAPAPSSTGEADAVT